MRIGANGEKIYTISAELQGLAMSPMAEIVSSLTELQKEEAKELYELMNEEQPESLEQAIDFLIN